MTNQQPKPMSVEEAKKNLESSIESYRNRSGTWEFVRQSEHYLIAAVRSECKENKAKSCASVESLRESIAYSLKSSECLFEPAMQEVYDLISAVRADTLAPFKALAEDWLKSHYVPSNAAGEMLLRAIEESEKK